MIFSGCGEISLVKWQIVSNGARYASSSLFPCIVYNCLINKHEYDRLTLLR